MAHPFSIFPEEVWELILDKVEDPKDVWNVLMAYPQLGGSTSLQKKKRIWLFGLIIPHVNSFKNVNFLKEKDILHCRQVCRTWSRAVDIFLENQPELRPYHPEEPPQAEGGHLYWNTKTYLQRQSVNDITAQKPAHPTHYGGVSFNPEVTFAEPRLVLPFMRDMEHHLNGRNPFLSGQLSLVMAAPDKWRVGEETYNGFWKDVLELHEKFGKHVWHYDMFSLLSTMHPLFPGNCLRCLTNLRSLHIMAPGDCTQNMYLFAREVHRSLPPLPHLETLKIDEDPKHLAGALIRRFSTQIRRLVIEIGAWRKEFGNMFPNLTELRVTNVKPKDSTTLKFLLTTLEAPQLAKFEFKFRVGGFVGYRLRRHCPFSIEDDLFQWLKRFPNMKYFDFGEKCRVVDLQEGGTLDPEKDSVPSLQFLAIQNYVELEYNFLRCLPSLQELHLYVAMWPVVLDHSSHRVDWIQEHIQGGTIYRSGIWEWLPKLRRVSLLVEDEEDMGILASYVYNREGYEYERRIGNGVTATSPEAEDEDELHFAPLRKDLIEFLEKEHNAEEVVDEFGFQVELDSSDDDSEDVEEESGEDTEGDDDDMEEEDSGEDDESDLTEGESYDDEDMQEKSYAEECEDNK